MKKCHKCYALYGNSDCICPPKLPSPAQMAEQQLATLTQERDALREVLRALIRAGDALYTKGKFADPDYWAACNWVTVVEESAALLTPPAGAGNGKEVGK